MNIIFSFKTASLTCPGSNRWLRAIGIALCAIPLLGGFSALASVAPKQNEAFSITATPTGARLSCDCQRVYADAATGGLWITSATQDPSAERFQIIGESIGRDSGRTIDMAASGTVMVLNHSVHFDRPGLTEAFSVSVEGIRQDFIVAKSPAGQGQLQLQLEVSGASVRSAESGVILTLPKSGRQFAYNRLKVTDARGRILPARLRIVGSASLLVTVDDTGATYPICVDPTISDANWVSIASPAGPNGMVRATLTDAHGNLYIGGTFTHIDGKAFANIALWNGVTWSALGTGLSSWFDDASVNALAFDSEGNLYAAGTFDTAGGIPADSVAKWDGKAWSALAATNSIPMSPVGSLAIDNSGNVYISGGTFTHQTDVARWDGLRWSSVGTVNGSDWTTQANTLAVDTKGILYVAGAFSSVGGVPALNIAQWDGAAWSRVGAGISYTVYTLMAGNDGAVYAGGEFGSAGDTAVSNIAIWDGIKWSALAGGLASGTMTLALDRAGALYAATADSVSKWDGAKWTSLPGHIPEPTSFESPYTLSVDLDGTIFAGGPLAALTGTSSTSLAQFAGSTWSPVGSLAQAGFDGIINAVVSDGRGSTYVGGNFSRVGNTAAACVARWDGSEWMTLGIGISGGTGSGPVVNAIIIDTADNLIIGGDFTSAGGQPATNIALWNGSSWFGLDSGVNGPVYALLAGGSNSVYVGGGFTHAGSVATAAVARWDGSTWSAAGNRGLGNYTIRSLARGPDNTLYAGGGDTVKILGSVFRLDASGWAQLPADFLGGAPEGNSSIISIAFDGSGQLFAIGAEWYIDTGVSFFSRYDGQKWFTVGGDDISNWSSSSISALLADQDGNIYLGGTFSRILGDFSNGIGDPIIANTQISADNIVKWDGKSFSALGSGSEGTVNALALDSEGNLFAAGNNLESGFVAELLLSTNSILASMQQVGTGTNLVTGSGTPGNTYILDLATNLAPPINWVAQATNTPLDTKLIFTNVTTAPQGFYRSRYSR